MATSAGNEKPRIAVFSGPTATIQNSEPLVTSNKAREKYGLPPRSMPTARRCVSTFCARSAWRRRSRSTLNNSARIRSNAMPPSFTRRRTAISTPAGVFHKERHQSDGQTCLRNHAQAGRRSVSASLHGAASQWASLGNGRHGKECAGRTMPRAVFSRRFTAFRRDRSLGDFRRRRGLSAQRQSRFRFLSRAAVRRLCDRPAAPTSEPISAQATSRRKLAA